MNRRPNIWKLQAEKDIKGLIAALQHLDPDIRKRSAAALRVLGNPEAVFALARALERERNPDVRDHLAAAIEYLDQDTLVESLIENQNVPGLIEMLASPRIEDVIRAARALGQIGDQRATEPLVTVFRNPVVADEVRLASAEALLELKSAPAVVTLLAALRKNNWRVRHNAAAVLGQLNATWATGPLIKCLEDEHAWVRNTAADSLGRFNNPRALKAVSEYRSKQEQGKTAPLPEKDGGEEETMPAMSTVEAVLDATEAPSGLMGRLAGVGSASEKDDTVVRMPAIKLENLQTNMDDKGEAEEETLSPALAAAEAALNQLSMEASPGGGSLFDEEDGSEGVDDQMDEATPSDDDEIPLE
ncbi:MAG: HEAT repeat domain-containing protein [Chloroflexi bacterium]|nr:HEAT repeat domain-containing protein [Chloroflexota bacterium]